jgi:tetratricopeptide repeat protein
MLNTLTALGREHQLTAWLGANLGAVLTERRAFAEAEALFVDALTRLKSRLGDDHRLVRRVHQRMADMYAASGRPQLAAQSRTLARGW